MAGKRGKSARARGGRASREGRPADFEASVRRVLDQHCRHAVLSNLPVFQADTGEDWLFANEIDQLFHCRDSAGLDHLVLVECKAMPISWSPHRPHRRAGAPRGRQGWFAHYGAGEATNVRVQLRDQAKSLLHFLGVNEWTSPALVVECWLVHETPDAEALVFEPPDGPVFRAFTRSQMDQHLGALMESARPVAVARSAYLAALSQGLPRDGQAHPPLQDALEHIARARTQIDRELYRRFSRWLPSKAGRWAIKGSAGSGKSVLLAYAAAVWATGWRIEGGRKGLDRRAEPCGDETRLRPGGLAPFAERRLQVAAMSRFQLAGLRRHFEGFVEALCALHPDGRPALRPVRFGVWDGRIDPACNVLVVDEAHDLDAPSRATVAAWTQEPGDRYLLVAVDRQQQLRREGTRARVFEGLDFRNRTNVMSRTYRSPFPVAAASHALLFRWGADTGPMVRPETERVTAHGGYTAFRGSLNAKVDESGGRCRVWMRNDAHPGNHWARTVDRFADAGELMDMLRRERLGKPEVLWLRFQARPGAPEERMLADAFDFHALGREGAGADAFADRNLKGLEFPVVVIEGLPEGFDDRSDPERMWNARRLVYLCASRATGFLYFAGVTDLPGTPGAEVSRVVDQLAGPVEYGPHGLGETWAIQFDWRDPIPVDDFEDAVPDPVEGTDADDEETAEGD